MLQSTPGRRALSLKAQVATPEEGTGSEKRCGNFFRICVDEEVAGKGWIRCLQVRASLRVSRVHNTFHVSNLKKCYSDEPLAVPLEGLHVDDKLHFVEEPVLIMDREVKRLKQSRIPICQDLMELEERS
ncbi:hypothetical protein Tco_1379340 [Tanacetum coccineum]